ncbi:hypothetical protein [Saccharibacillus endophyticus]|uniref:Uncharacterized protein n=1 Tax=Saccharibacillus endophyticus TaxID=2060666 RepID=A0ABQ2A0Y3_9BACL|nr:hypothetical protein [Saccharibacillus endophyticus]GGH81824.1 hypothetical protein GCM10007362_32210 [Saccharibacillus endophyticus]
MKIKSFKFRRSESGLKDMLEQSINIIRTSLELIENERRPQKEFVKVVSGQLRLLLFENDKSLMKILYKDDLNLPIISNDFREFDGTKFLNPLNMFSDSALLNLEQWTEQVIAEAEIEVPSPEYLTCKKCSEKLSLKHEHDAVEVRILLGEPQNAFEFRCKHCGKFCETIIDQDDPQNVLNISASENITVYSLLRSFADKGGGAHVDKELNWLNVFAVELGDLYVISIAKCILSFHERQSL